MRTVILVLLDSQCSLQWQAARRQHPLATIPMMTLTQLKQTHRRQRVNRIPPSPTVMRHRMLQPRQILPKTNRHPGRQLTTTPIRQTRRATPLLMALTNQALIARQAKVQRPDQSTTLDCQSTRIASTTRPETCLGRTPTPHQSRSENLITDWDRPAVLRLHGTYKRI